MVNPEAVITQVKQGNYPANWHVYRGTGSYGFVTMWAVSASIIFLLFIPLGLSEASAGLIVSGILLAIVCIISAWYAKEKADTAKRYFLVILPGGVTHYAASVSWLDFQNIYKIDLVQRTQIYGIDGDISSRTYYWLDIYCLNGTYFEWWTDRCFGDTAFMCKSVIAAYDYYWLNNNYLS